jgi:hypothetical protein
MLEMFFLAFSVAVAISLAQTEVDAARAACERDVDACPRWREIKAKAAEADAVRLEAERRAADERRRVALAEATEAERLEAARVEALRLKCGVDFRRMRVGMAWARAVECADSEWREVQGDRRGSVYRSALGVARVEKGKIVSWLAAE